VGGFGDHPFSYSMGNIGSFPEGGCGESEWSWPLTSRYAEVKNEWRYTETSPYSLWCVQVQFLLYRQVIFRRPLTAEVRVEPRTSLCGMCCRQVALGQVFPLSALFRQWSILMYLSPTNLAIFSSFWSFKHEMYVDHNNSKGGGRGRFWGTVSIFAVRHWSK
jgi:hypothetical protein